MGIIDNVFPDGVPVAKADVRADDKSGKRRNMAAVDDVRNADLSGQTAGIYVRELQQFYDLDTGDTTTPDDGDECIIDYAGNRFKKLDLGAGSPAAGDVSYSNATSGLSATDVQAAIDELAAGGGSGSLVLTPQMFGAVSDEDDTDHDCATELQDLFDFVAALPTSANMNHYPVDGGGRTFCTSEPLDLPNRIALTNIQFKALDGSNWMGASGLLTKGDNAVLNIVNKGFVTLKNVAVDCNRIEDVQGIYASGPNYSNEFHGVKVRHWVDGGNGMIFTGGFGLTDSSGCDVQQWVDGDAEYGIAADRSGIALGLFGAVDGLFNGFTFGNTLVPMFIDKDTHTNRFNSLHPYTVSAPGSPTANPYGIVYDGYDNHFDDLYLDIVPFLIRTTAATVNGRPTLSIRGVHALYNAAHSTFSAWFQFTTSLASTPLYGVIIKDSSLPGAYPFSFATTGSGSWDISAAALALLNAAPGDASLMEPTGSTTEYLTNIELLGYGVLSGYLNKVTTDTGTTRNISADDSGRLLLMTNGSSVALTALANVTKGITVPIFLSNVAGTIVAGSGGSINGSTSAIPLFKNKLYWLMWIYGTGANAQYALSEQPDIAATTHAATSKTTPVDADEIPLVDSAASNILKKLTWANLKATIASYLVSAGFIRETLTSSRTYYVRTDGSDSNNGLANTSGGAFLTIQKALTVTATLDLSIYNVTIQIGNGTYTAGAAVTAPWVGSGSVTLLGDATTPSNVVISTTNADAVAVSGFGSKLSVSGVKCQTTTSGSAFSASYGGRLTHTGKYEVGALAEHANKAVFGGVIVEASITANITGNIAGSFYFAGRGSALIQSESVTWAITGTPSVGSFANASVNSTVYSAGNSASGSMTGQRYNVALNGVVFTNGAGASYFPGGTAGATATGGQYS